MGTEKTLEAMTKKSKAFFLFKKYIYGAGNTVQLVEILPRMYEALGSTPRNIKKSSVVVYKLRRRMQDDQNFKVIPSYMESPIQVWDTW